jgi:hypothetical protein
MCPVFKCGHGPDHFEQIVSHLYNCHPPVFKHRVTDFGINLNIALRSVRYCHIAEQYYECEALEDRV